MSSTPDEAVPDALPRVALPAVQVLLQPALLSLSDHGVLRVRGADAGAFLQGQLTQQVSTPDARPAPAAGQLPSAVPAEALAQGLPQALPAALLNPKGRMLASFWLWSQSADAGDPEPVWWLVCTRALAPMLARRLGMFVLRARVRVEDLSETHRVQGVIGDIRQAVQGADAPGAAQVVAQAALSDAPVLGSVAPAVRALRVVVADGVGKEGNDGAGANDDSNGNDDGDGNDAKVVLEAQAAAGTRRWQVLEILSAQARILPATVEAFVPQMVNFELIGGVDFRKGCFPGQEVVARSQYLGRQKRRLGIAIGHGEEPLPMSDVHAGSTIGPGGVQTAPSEPVGAVVMAVAIDAALFAALDTVALQGPAQEHVQKQAEARPDSPVTSASAPLGDRAWLMMFEAALPDAALPLRVDGGAVRVLPLPYAIPTAAPVRPRL